MRPASPLPKHHAHNIIALLVEVDRLKEENRVLKGQLDRKTRWARAWKQRAKIIARDIDGWHRNYMEFLNTAEEAKEQVSKLKSDLEFARLALRMAHKKSLKG